MNEKQTAGLSSISLSRPVFIQSCASVVGKKEGEGPLGNLFDLVCEEPMFGSGTWEAAESAMQREAAVLAAGKAGYKPEEIRLAFAGDLLAQTTASSFGIAGLGIPFYGLYGACSTMGESLSLGSMSVSAGYGEPVLCATSSHFASAEKEFRFPLGYGNQRPLSATWTVTGSGACILSTCPPSKEQQKKYTPLASPKGFAAITGLTTGRLIDFGFKDSLNMGGCMAPAACDTIWQHLYDFGRAPSDYDCIFTGDLGMVGQKILFDLLAENNKTQDTHSGGSGCGCAAAVLTAYILPKVAAGEWKRILFVPTGALLSKVSFNEGVSIPGIAHAVIIEHIPI